MYVYWGLCPYSEPGGRVLGVISPRTSRSRALRCSSQASQASSPRFPAVWLLAGVDCPGTIVGFNYTSTANPSVLRVAFWSPLATFAQPSGTVFLATASKSRIPYFSYFLYVPCAPLRSRKNPIANVRFGLECPAEGQSIQHASKKTSRFRPRRFRLLLPMCLCPESVLGGQPIRTHCMEGPRRIFERRNQCNRPGPRRLSSAGKRSGSATV